MSRLTNIKVIAQLTLPSEDNDGQSLSSVHRTLKTQLATSFGGYTAFETGGGWVDENGQLVEEDGTTYQVALKPDQASVDLFRSIVLDTGREAKQKAMFYVIDAIARVESLEV